MGVVNAALVRASHLALPILDGFLVLMIATETLSIFSHMYTLNLPVPALAVKLVTGLKDKTAKALEETSGAELTPGPVAPDKDGGPHDPA